MDQIDGICSDYVQVKGEQSIILKMKGMEREKDARIVITVAVSNDDFNFCLFFEKLFDTPWHI